MFFYGTGQTDPVAPLSSIPVRCHHTGRFCPASVPSAAGAVGCTMSVSEVSPSSPQERRLAVAAGCRPGHSDQPGGVAGLHQNEPLPGEPAAGRRHLAGGGGEAHRAGPGRRRRHAGRSPEEDGARHRHAAATGAGTPRRRLLRVAAAGGATVAGRSGAVPAVGRWAGVVYCWLFGTRKRRRWRGVGAHRCDHGARGRRRPSGGVGAPCSVIL